MDLWTNFKLLRPKLSLNWTKNGTDTKSWLSQLGQFWVRFWHVCILSLSVIHIFKIFEFWIKIFEFRTKIFKSSGYFRHFWHIWVDSGFSIIFSVSFAKVLDIWKLRKFSNYCWTSKYCTGKVERPKISGKRMALVEKHLLKRMLEEKSFHNTYWRSKMDEGKNSQQIRILFFSKVSSEHWNNSIEKLLLTMGKFHQPFDSNAHTS